jgi:thiaminase/transcriptional activator TenA
MPTASLYHRLIDANAIDWQSYTAHPFVLGIQNGSLPKAAFRHYLIQDYLFLIHFARAYALSAYKAQSLQDIRAAAESLRIITEVEMGLHVKFCKAWGLTESEMQSAPEAVETMAYTRYVLECGLAGDGLDLQVALAPCLCGYAEIGKWLANDSTTQIEGNPYREWIEMYASDEYQSGSDAAIEMLDRLFEQRAGLGRMDDLIRIFGQATRLESQFWQMGLDAAD